MYQHFDMLLIFIVAVLKIDILTIYLFEVDGEVRGAFTFTVLPEFVVDIAFFVGNEVTKPIFHLDIINGVIAFKDVPNVKNEADFLRLEEIFVGFALYTPFLRHAFAYTHVIEYHSGIGEVFEQAQVNIILVNRYFGSEVFIEFPDK